jgi:hypothetical protein
MMNTALNISIGNRLEVLRETTRDWNSANHTYVLKNDRLIAYVKHGTDEVIMLNPLNFSKKFRTFTEVKGDELADIVFSLTG